MEKRRLIITLTQRELDLLNITLCTELEMLQESIDDGDDDQLTFDRFDVVTKLKHAVCQKYWECYDAEERKKIITSLK